jgi:DNA invertase Pin-like site-specific DNA recombinase
MTAALPCAIYTRKSSEEGLEQGFNSLDAQREACAAYILSQKALGWKAVATPYDDGGFTGGNLGRPGLQRLLADIAAHRVRIVVVYKVDRLTRSLADFAKLVELFDAHEVSFVSVTQQFNTTTSMGRLTLNVLLSFAQFEREVTGERIRDKIAASKRKGMWMGGMPPIGYVARDRQLVVDPDQEARVQQIYRLYLELGCVRKLQAELGRRGWVTPARLTRRADARGGRPFSRGHLHSILRNPIYVGKIVHRQAVFDGQHPAIIEQPLWDGVQEQLRSNRQGERSGTSASSPSLLTGLVFDERGNRLTPTHAKKGARRYRYYAAGELLRDARDVAPEALRLPAQALEDAVVAGLTGWLADETQLMNRIGERDSAETRRLLHGAGEAARQLREAPAGHLTQWVERVVVDANSLKVAVKASALLDDPSRQAPTRSPIELNVPVRVQRCGSATRLIVKAPGALPRSTPDATLVALLARAADWFRRLTSGQANSVAQIAQAEGVTNAYVIRVTHLAMLAPDIVQKITRGDHPPALNAERLIHLVPLPMDWAEQRAVLGFDR